MIFGIIIIFGVCGNLFVIIVIFWFKCFWYFVNSYLILNFVVSDFLIVFFFMLYYLVIVLDFSIIVDNGLLCKVGGILLYLFYIFFIVILVMLVIERYIVVSDLLRYMSCVIVKMIVIMVGYLWF